MIRMMFCLQRLQSLSLEEFQRYWHEMHAPHVARHATTIGLALYRQHHWLSDPTLGALLNGRLTNNSFDGIAELCWNDQAELSGSGSDAAIRKANRELYEDEQRFIDLSRSPILFVNTIEIAGPTLHA